MTSESVPQPAFHPFLIAFGVTLHFQALNAPTKNVYDLLKSRSELSEFVSLVDQAGLADYLKSTSLEGTVLVPTNRALERSLNQAEKRRLLANRAHLRRFLKEHILRGK